MYLTACGHSLLSVPSCTSLTPIKWQSLQGGRSTAENGLADSLVPETCWWRYREAFAGSVEVGDKRMVLTFPSSFMFLSPQLHLTWVLSRDRSYQNKRIFCSARTLHITLNCLLMYYKWGIVYHLPSIIRCPIHFCRSNKGSVTIYFIIL